MTDTVTPSPQPPDFVEKPVRVKRPKAVVTNSTKLTNRDRSLAYHQIETHLRNALLKAVPLGDYEFMQTVCLQASRAKSLADSFAKLAKDDKQEAELAKGEGI